MTDVLVACIINVAGLGFLTPFYLGNIPVIGPICSSVSTSLARADASLGGIGHKLATLSNRGSRFAPGGMSFGYGCGIFLGYGFGAGVMIKGNSLQSLGDRLKALVPANLQSLSVRNHYDQKILDGDNSQKASQLGQNEQTPSLQERVQRLENKIQCMEVELSKLRKSVAANDPMLKNIEDDNQ